jgi:predicted membrane GTPase involved in stress response
MSTTARPLVDRLLQQSGAFGDNQRVAERATRAVAGLLTSIATP